MSQGVVEEKQQQEQEQQEQEKFEQEERELQEYREELNRMEELEKGMYPESPQRPKHTLYEKVEKIHDDVILNRLRRARDWDSAHTESKKQAREWKDELKTEFFNQCLANASHSLTLFTGLYASSGGFKTENMCFTTNLDRAAELMLVRTSLLKDVINLHEAITELLDE